MILRCAQDDVRAQDILRSPGTHGRTSPNDQVDLTPPHRPDQSRDLILVPPPGLRFIDASTAASITNHAFEVNDRDTYEIGCVFDGNATLAGKNPRGVRL